MTALPDQFDDEFVVKVSGGEEAPDLPAGFDIVNMEFDTEGNDYYTLRRRNEDA